MNKKKILLISLSGIGNSMLAIQFLRGLNNSVAARIDILTLNGDVAEIFKKNKLINNSFILTKNIIKSIFLIIKLHLFRYDYSVTLFPSNKIAFNLLAFLLAARFRITHSYEGGEKMNFGFLQNIKIEANEHLHDLDQNMQLLKIFNPRFDSYNAESDLKLDSLSNSYARDFLKKNRLQSVLKVGIHPGCGGFLNKNWQGVHKRWPHENFLRLSEMLIERDGVSVLVFGGREEAEIKYALKKNSKYPEKIFIVPFCDLSKTAALIKYCSFFISNDSGLMQLASALNVPTLGIFGPTNYRRTAPWGKSGYYLKSNLACSPCLKYPFHTRNSRIKCSRNLECLKNISVARLIAEIDAQNLLQNL